MAQPYRVSLFEENTKINRDDINKRLTQASALFPVPVANGGTGCTTAGAARHMLGGDGRTVHYKNASGTTSQINFSRASGYLARLGIYYGADNVKKYIELPPAKNTWDTYHTIINMQYLASNGDLLIRTTDLVYGYSSVSVSSERSGNRCYRFTASGNTSYTTENIYIYEVVGYYTSNYDVVR